MANISFCCFLGLLLWIQSWLYAEGHDRIIDKYALIGQQVNSTCYLNSTEGVTWLYRFHENYFHEIYTCEYNQNGQCISDNANPFWGLVYSDLNLQATRSNDTSVLSLTKTRLLNENELYFKCKLGKNIQQEYSVKSTDLRNIVPNCSITSPHSDETGVGSITLSCEVNSGELDVNLKLEGIGLDIPDNASMSSQSIRAKTLYFDNSNNIHNASCNAYFPYIDITLSCTYLNIIKTKFIVEGNDIIVECNGESDVVNWGFYASDGREEDIKNRSWSRKGGRSLLIRDMSEQDVGKVVVCRTKGDDNQTHKGTVGFTVISKLTGNNTNSISYDPVPIPSAYNPYFFFTLIFLSLWLITIDVCGVWFGSRSRRSHEVSTIPRTSDDEQTPLAPEYATVILSTSGGKDLDTHGPSSGGLGLTGEEPEGERKKSSRKEPKEHYMDMSGNHGPTEYKTMKSVTYENPRADHDVVPEGSSQVNSGSTDVITMGKEPVRLEGSKAYYMDMSGNHGRTDYEAMKSLTYANV